MNSNSGGHAARVHGVRKLLAEAAGDAASLRA